MAAKVAQQTELTEEERLDAWRMCVYTGAGMSLDVAEKLATAKLDTHVVMELWDRGCPNHFMAEILL